MLKPSLWYVNIADETGTDAILTNVVMCLSVRLNGTETDIVTFKDWVLFKISRIETVDLHFDLSKILLIVFLHCQ